MQKHASSNNLTDLFAKKQRFFVNKGQNIIIEGSPIQGLFFVFEGKAKVVKTGAKNKQQIVRLTNNGDVLGHRGFCAGEQYQIGAVALTDSTLCSFDSQLLSQYLKSDVSLTFDFMKFYAEELNSSEEKVKQFSQMSVRERFIDALLYLEQKFGVVRGYINLELSRQEIADFIGTTVEQAIRMISALKKENLIKTSGKKISILEHTALKKEVEAHHFFSHLL